jgi:PHP family Zn ribbon phosphoesterase
MSPKRIAEMCKYKHIDIIAICDHNSAENAGAVIRAGKEKGICVLPGIEVCSKEEVHILTIFEELDQANGMQEYVYGHLKGENNPELFGYQVIALETDEVVCESPKMLIGAAQVRIHDIIDKAHSLNGICIASHVDRTTYGIIGQLGFIPPDLPLDAIEISSQMTADEAKKKIQGIDMLPIITSSDAHSPENIGISYTEFWMAAPTFKELNLATKGRNGREVVA